MFKAAFWLAALERATKTFAQTAVGLWGGDAVLDKVGVSIIDINIGDIVGYSASAAVLSVLTSLASIPLSPGSSPSLVPAAETEAAAS